MSPLPVPYGFMSHMDRENFYLRYLILYGRGKKKVEAIPLRARTGPESSRSLRLPDFKTIGT